MELVHFGPEGVATFDVLPASLSPDGWFWLDVVHEVFQQDPEQLREQLARWTGVRLFDLHLQDAGNLAHPSFFDCTDDYEVVVFRKLVGTAVEPHESSARANDRRALSEIQTAPVTFFVLDRLLVTVRDANSRTIAQLRSRLLERRSRENVSDRQRMPARPEELMLRMLNAMVDRYLELRQPLTAQLDRWQRELLDPRRPFDNWSALLKARNELRRLESLSEEQYDALQELRDNYLDATPQAVQSDAHLVRIADVMEHIGRVMSHTRRLEASIETAVQLHFSATSHRTNQIVQTLTIITAIFAPLTLLTGVFGMNFEAMPLVKHPLGFWWLLAAMAAIGLALLGFFLARRYLRLRDR